MSGDYHILPGYPEVHCFLDWLDDEDGGEVTVVFTGFADDLIASGVATPEMLAPKAKGKHNERRLDSDGEQVKCCRYVRRRNGQPTESFRLTRVKTIANALLKLPGAAMLIEAERREKAERASTKARAVAPATPAARNVIDATSLFKTRQQQARDPRLASIIAGWSAMPENYKRACVIMASADDAPTGSAS